MSKTTDNLKSAFAGESQAYRKYKAFAKKAEEEGHYNAAKLFKAAAKAEKIHALSHMNNLGLLKSTAENLQAAVQGETYEFTEMYPDFIQQAKEEGNTAAARAFHLANEAEKVHAKLYQDALNNLNDKTEKTYYLCPICGFIEEGDQHERCPICGAMKSVFKKID
jgi:rubrerythrin